MDPAARVYSCDDHLDLAAVPRGVWQSRLARVHVDRGPRVVAQNGQSVWLCEDRVLGRSGGSPLFAKFSAIGRAGIEDDGFRAGTPELRLQDIAHLTGGAVVELDCSPDDPVEIMVNDRVIAHGEVVVVDGNYGVRITKMANRNGKNEAEEHGTDLLTLSDQLR